MLNKVQFTAKDLNTMYAAGILHTRESLGYGNNFKKAGIGVSAESVGEANKADSKKSETSVDMTTVQELIEQLQLTTNAGKSSNPNKDANTNPDGNTSSGGLTTESMSSGKASSGMAAKADYSAGTKLAQQVGGMGAATAGLGPVGLALVAPLIGMVGKWAEQQQQQANNAEAKRQQDAMDTLMANLSGSTTDVNGSSSGGTDNTSSTNVDRPSFSAASTY